MTASDYENLRLWIKEKVDNHAFGEVHVTIKLRDGKVQMLQRAFTENFLLSGNTGGQNAGHR